MTRNILLALTVLFSFAVYAHEGHDMKAADAQAINDACKADASTAGCDSEVVGKGLLKCLWTYKKEHKKDFKFTDACKDAMHKMHADRKGDKN